MKVYWYRQRPPNFGDVLTLPLLRGVGVLPVWAPASTAQFFGIGSNLQLVPPGFSGTIWGIGTPNPALRRDLSAARVLAVRGPLTAECAGITWPVLMADPGLLASDLLPERPAATVAHGMIRHFSDSRPTQSCVICILGRVTRVIRQAAVCQRITSSSLHGLVLADALGIPNRWTWHRTQKVVKFEDYAAAFGESIQPMRWRLADQRLVAEKQAALRSTLAQIALGTL